MSRTIAVMYLGKIVEIGDADAIALEPKHPYTKALFAAALPIDLDRPREEITLSARFEPAGAADRLPLSSTVPVRDASLRDRGAAAAARERPAGCVPPLLISSGRLEAE